MLLPQCMELPAFPIEEDWGLPMRPRNPSRLLSASIEWIQA
jgi:hypothetical protein